MHDYNLHPLIKQPASDDGKLKVIFCCPSRRKAHPAWFEALEASIPLVVEAGFHEGMTFTTGNPYISGARASMLKQGLNAKGDIFVFLDDDHDAAHVREEIRLAKKLLRPGGIICVHDVVGPFGLGDVVREAGGIVVDTPRFHAAGGLGIIT